MSPQNRHFALRTVSLVALIGLASCHRRGEGEEPPPFAPDPRPPPAMGPPPQPQLPAEAPPLGRLPADLRPTRYSLALAVMPEADRFSGTVEIAIEGTRPRDVIWMHGKGLAVKVATVTPEGGAPIPARFDQIEPGGVAALRLTRAIGPGRAKIHLEYDAAYGQRLEGLYKVKAAGTAYVFTQFESVYARQAFPCFDEPAFKTPFDVTLFVPKGNEAIANTHETARADAGNGLTRVTFAATEPLPTYLIALAAGPLDVVAAAPVPPNAVRKRALPLRGVAAKGRGPELAYALANAGPILAALEGYFGIEYPYDKLDLLAVPDKGGAMENAGAVTFREWLLLVDEKTAPIGQKRAFANVMAHELAHMWFGDLVTMPWWDDIWLNEAFATWMASRTVKTWRPDYQAEVSMLEGVEGAMGTDALISSRQIRNEVKGNDDIMNAFDGITYQKGGGVLAMFERWVGPDIFQRGIQRYLAAHRFGLATSDDLLRALSEASGKDVATPFRTFLFQSGVPYVETVLACDDKKAVLKLKQSRFLPLGSTGDPNRTWQIPICARYQMGPSVRETCTLLTDREGVMPLEGPGCPQWIVPNADGAGYYRWSLPAADLAKLGRDGYSHLSVRERMTFANSLRAGFSRGTTPAADVLTTVAPLARDAHPAVATAPMDFLRSARLWLENDPLRASVEAHGRKLYGGPMGELGWGPEKGKREEPERQLLRQELIGFLAFSARDPAVRKEAAARGRAYVGFGKDGAIHPEAVDSNLAGTALMVAGEEGDAAFFDGLLAKLDATQDEVVRGRLLSALAAAQKPELAARARDLTLDPRLKVIEVMTPIGVQMQQPETRDLAWKYFTDHLDAIVARLPPGRAGGLPWQGTYFCDRAKADEVERLFAPRIARLEGGPRNLAGALESMRLCAARKDKQLESMKSFFKASAAAPPKKKK